MDAIDTALVSFENEVPELVAYEQFPIAEQLKSSVRVLNASTSIGEVTKFDAIMGHLFADSVLKILEIADIPPEKISAIGNHGQTILHLPDDSHPRTLQIGDPNIIAQKTKINTVADFRRMDMADNGQGAPLAPAFHAKVFRKQNINRVTLNLGGIANTTILPAEIHTSISGFDTGPGNGLLDDWNQLHNHTEMDIDSQWAATGNPDHELLALLLSDPYFKLAPPKSSGRDYFNLEWLHSRLDSLNRELAPENIQATLLQLTILTIADAIKRHAPKTSEIYMCGGGCHNKRMTKALASLMPEVHLGNTQELGLNPDAIEAITFAWLAKQTMEAKAGNEPSVTGANSGQILGGIYQAANN